MIIEYTQELKSKHFSIDDEKTFAIFPFVEFKTRLWIKFQDVEYHQSWFLFAVYSDFMASYPFGQVQTQVHGEYA